MRGAWVLSALIGATLAGRAFGAGNILVIIADDLGVDCVGVYGEGSSLPSTPNIDLLASQGVLFRNVWSNPVCSSSRATFMTGRYSFRTGVGAHVKPKTQALPRTEFTLPELFNLNPGLGYRHACIGKWHLGSESTGDVLSPNLAGFHHYEGNLYGIWTFVSPGHGLGNDYYEWTKTENGRQAQAKGYNTTAIVDDALDWTRRIPGPWFCVVSFCTPHDPWHAPPPHLHSVKLPIFSPKTNPRPYFEAMVESMDTEIGRLLRGVGWGAGETTVIFCGDNGTHPDVTLPPFIPTHGKWSVYEGGVNVPLIVSGPSVRGRGRVSSALVNTTDLFATVAELAGIDVAQTLPAGCIVDSVSLVPYLEDPRQPGLRDSVFAEWFSPIGSIPTNWKYAIRNHRYKLIRRLQLGSFAPDQLYDLETDPFEQNNLLSAGLWLPEVGQAYSELQRGLEDLLP